MAYQTDPVQIPIEAEAQLNQIESEVSKVNNAMNKGLARTSGAERRNPQLASINNSIRNVQDSLSKAVQQLREFISTPIVNPEYKELDDIVKATTKENVQLEKSINKINTQLDKEYEKQRKLRDLVTDAKSDMVMTADYSNTVNQLGDVETSVEKVASRIKNIKTDIDLNDKSLKNFSEDLESTTKAYQKALAEKGEKSIDTKGLKARMEDLTRYVNGAKQKAIEYREELAKSEEELVGLVKQAEELKNKKDEIAKSGKAYEYADPELVKEREQALERSEEVTSALIQEEAHLQVQLEENKDIIEQTNATMQEMRDAGTDTIDPTTTEQYQVLLKRIEALERKLAQLGVRQDQAAGGAKEWGRVIQRFVVSALGMALSYILKMKSAINQGIINVFKNIGKTILTNIVGALKQVPAIVANIKSGMNQLAGVIANKVGSAILGVASGFKNLLGLVGRGIISIGRTVGSKFAGIFSSFTSSLMGAFDFSGTIQDIADDYVSDIVSARDSAQKQLDDYVAKTSEIDLSVNPQVVANIDKLKNKVAELDNQLQHTNNTMGNFGSKSAMVTFQNLVGQINDLKASLQQLRYSWVAAFAPLASVVIPYLQKLVSWIITVVNTIGQFIAALTGHGTFLKAKKVSAGGGGGGGGSKATKKDTKATKDNTKAKKENNEEINKQLSGLDKLNVLHADETKDLEDQADILDDIGDLDDDLGGAGGFGGLGDLFEEAEIPDWVKKWADKLKEMWEKADFTELGALAGEKLKELLDSIPWDKIQNFAVKLGKSMATFLNGFLEVAGLAESVGRTLGEAINTIQMFLTSFVDNFHWQSLGAFIGNGLMEAFRTIDWPAIGHLFSSFLNGVFSAVDAFLQKFDPDLVSTSITDMVNKAFTDFNWSYTSTIIGRFFRKLFDTISQTMDKLDFEGLGKGLTAFLGNKNMWRSLFVGITDTLNSAFNALQRFMDGFDGIKIVKNIASSINEGFANFKWKENGKTIGNFLYGLIDAILTFIEDIDFTQILNGIIDALEGLRWQDIADRFTDFIKNLKLGDFAKTLSDRIKNDIKWEQIGETFAKKWNTLFDKAKEWAENFDGKGILEKIALAINTAVKNFNWVENGESVGNFVKGFIDAITNFLQTLDKESIVQGIADFLDSMDWDGIVDSFDNLLDELESWLDEIESKIDWDKVDKLISRVIDRVVAFLEHAISIVDLSKVKNTIKSVIMSKLKLNWPEILAKLFGGAVLLNLVANAGKKMGGSFVGGFLSKLGGGTFAEGVASSLGKAGASGATEAAATGLGTLVGGMIVASLMGVVAAGISTGLADAIARANGYEDGLKGFWKEQEKGVEDTKKAIENGVIPAYKELQSTARSVNYGDSAGYARQMDELQNSIKRTHPELQTLNNILEENNVKVKNNAFEWMTNYATLGQIQEGLQILETNGNDVNGMLSELAGKYGEVDNATYKFFDHLRDGDEAYIAVQNAVRESGTIIDTTANTIEQSNDKILHSSQTVEDWYASQGKSQEYYDSLVTNVENASNKITEKSERLNIELDKVPTSVREAIQKADQEAQWATQSLEQNMDRLPTSVVSAIQRANQESQWESQSLANNLDRLPTSARDAILAMDNEFATTNMPNLSSFDENVSNELSNMQTENLALKSREAVTAMDSEFTTTNMPNLQAMPEAMVEDLKIPAEQVVISTQESLTQLDSTFTTDNMPNAKTLGTNISDGLRDGLVNGLATIVGAITPGLQGIITTVQTIFQVHSPSVVMQNIGRDIVQGLINGWTQNIGSFTTQISNFGTQFVNAFTNVRSRVLNVVSSMVSSVRSALSSLASMVSSVISQISNAVSNVGNQVSNMANNAYRSVSSRITIPRHATGQVIPPSMSEYLAILGDNNKETEVVSPLSTMKQAMIEAMGEMSMYGFGGGNSGDIVIQIDGREVFRAVQNQNSQYYKQTGANAW